MERETEMEREESSLAADFDSSAFMNDDYVTPTDETTDEVEDTTEDTAYSDTETATETEAETTDWTDEVEDVTDEDTTEDTVNETTETNTDDSWKDIAEAVGINADDYETFIETLKGQKDLASKGATNQKIEGLNKLVSLDDETLMRKELEARGFTSDEIEDEIDILIENNTIRSKAREVRKDLESLISAEKNSIATQTQEVDATQQQEIEEAAAELRDYMSKTTEMFGGKINSTQKERHAEYITSGKFFDEISNSAETMAQAAWLWKYKDQILNGQRSSGVEKGKKQILDKMVNPEPTRKNRIPDPETGEFNPNRFMDSEQM